jgi:hypothetical protein
MKARRFDCLRSHSALAALRYFTVSHNVTDGRSYFYARCSAGYARLWPQCSHRASRAKPADVLHRPAATAHGRRAIRRNTQENVPPASVRDRSGRLCSNPRTSGATHRHCPLSGRSFDPFGSTAIWYAQRLAENRTIGMFICLSS